MRQYHTVALALLSVLAVPVATLTESTDVAKPGSRACPLKAELVQEDATNDYSVELLQRDMKRGEALKRSEKPRLGVQGKPVAFAALESSLFPTIGIPVSEFDCEQHPVYCDPKLNCSKMTEDDRFKLHVHIATDDGHANLQTWCASYPTFASALPHCLSSPDLPSYAKYMYEEEGAKDDQQSDAMYCFASGYCNNDKVTVNTTLEEAEEICTELFGHTWKSIGLDDIWSSSIQAETKDKEAFKSGTLSKEEVIAMTKRNTDIFAMTACAMGNFHCDTIYCRENYCNNPVYQEFAWLGETP